MLHDLGRKLSIEEVAELFDVAPKTVERYARQYGGVKIGQKRLFFENLVSDLVRKCYALQVDPTRESYLAGTGADRRENYPTAIRDKKGGDGLGTQLRATGTDADPFNLLTGVGK